MKTEITCTKCCTSKLELFSTSEYVDYLIKKGTVKEEDRHTFILIEMLMPKPYYCGTCDRLISWFDVIGRSLMRVDSMASPEIIRGFMRSTYTPKEDNEKP